MIPGMTVNVIEPPRLAIVIDDGASLKIHPIVSDARLFGPALVRFSRSVVLSGCSRAWFGGC